MALLRCEGTYDGYEDCEEDYDSWSDDQERLEHERQLDDLADRLYNEAQEGERSMSSAKAAFRRATRQ